MKDLQNDHWQFPSDFSSSKEIGDIVKIFEGNDFYNGRMIGGSKSDYHNQYPNDLIVFNANVLTRTHGKVWYGDLNVTQDEKILKSIAEQVNEPLYVLYEMDARFGNEEIDRNILIERACWSTNEDGSK